MHALQVVRINLQHFYSLKLSFFPLQRSHLCPLSLSNTAPSQVLFILFHEYLWNLSFFLHYTAIRKKKTYSKLLFLKKKAPHLPSCSPFCLSLIHFPHKQILLKHRLDHVTIPLKSSPEDFPISQENAKFLTLIWNDKQGSPLLCHSPSHPPTLHPRQVYQPLFELLLYSNLFPDSSASLSHQLRTYDTSLPE